MRKIFLGIIVFFAVLTAAPAFSQPATVRLDARVRHQYVTGFGGFVCSPQFTYNHMSTSDIKKVWGAGSTVGCNIMRLYIPVGKNAWSQSLQTAKNAKQMGLIVFASPWGQPAEWKTNGTSNAKNSDGTLGYLKKENWPDYAQYLEDYVQYLRNNGVELDAISIQNEPDWAATYAGCLWSASDIAEFVKTYGATISCKVIAPETLAVSDNYANALNKSDVLPGFDIYGGHQYGGIQSAYKNLAAKGKELWMTEYLINWNENQASNRNFDFSKDFFDFFRAINTCMLGDFNVWVHYAAKRYYGMLGDGQMGTSAGVVTKRGWVMAHFARFVTGMTRIDSDFGSAGLEGSAYLSTTGDTVVAVVANEAEGEVSVRFDLPFYTQEGKMVSTTRSKSFQATTLALEGETCRPVVSIEPRSVATVLFIRSSDRQPSDMKGGIAHFNRLDDMVATKSMFGTTYKLSGKTKTFDHNTPLISSRTNANYGFVALDNRYTRLVMQVKKMTSTLNYSSALTTLTYVNANGEVSTHNYGDLEFTQRENFNIVLDLSPQTLPDGCQGLISLTNNNWSSTLSITFGDVYLAGPTAPYAATLTGAYVADDTYVLDYTNDANCTSLDLTGVTLLPTELPWMGGNRVAYLPVGSSIEAANVVVDGQCALLTLTPDGGDFLPATPFTAQQATLTLQVDGLRMVMLPFAATVPEGARVYAVDEQLSLTPLETVPALTPVVVEARGEVVFTGNGEVASQASPLTDMLRGAFTRIHLYIGDYVLSCRDGQWGFTRLEEDAVLEPFAVYACLDTSEPFIALKGGELGVNLPVVAPQGYAVVHDLSGRRVTTSHSAPGIYIVNGKKMVVKE
ncbi:MAG: hypothetical protein J5529_05010 [Prevotella sp.]|nr:hypothetical protein [Prevotella sp.]